jgi:uncharacterized membrane protein required for colicin V production
MFYIKNKTNDKKGANIMGIFLDVLTVAVYIIVICHAYRKGLIRAVIEVVGFVAAFVISYLLSQPLGVFIDNTFLNKLVHGSLIQFAATQSGAAQTVFLTQIMSQLPNTMSKGLQSLDLGMSSLGSNAAVAIANSVSMPLASILSRWIAFFIILLICLTIVGFVARLSSAVVHIPVIGTLNAIGGAVVGLIEAMIIMFFISALVSLLITLFALQKNPPITSQIVNSTYVFKYVHNINPLTGMLLNK